MKKMNSIPAKTSTKKYILMLQFCAYIPTGTFKLFQFFVELWL